MKKYIWNIINSCFIILFGLIIVIFSDINSKMDSRIHDLEVKVKTYETMHPDTIVVNINNKN